MPSTGSLLKELAKVGDPFLRYDDGVWAAYLFSNSSDENYACMAKAFRPTPDEAVRDLWLQVFARRSQAAEASNE